MLYIDEQSGVHLGGSRFKSMPQQILHDPAVILGIFKPDTKMQLGASLCLSLCMEQCDSHQMIHIKFRIWNFH